MELSLGQKILSGFHKCLCQQLAWWPTTMSDIPLFNGFFDISKLVSNLGAVGQKILVTPFPAIDLFTICASSFLFGLLAFIGDAVFQLTTLFVHTNQLIFEKVSVFSEV